MLEARGSSPCVEGEIFSNPPNLWWQVDKSISYNQMLGRFPFLIDGVSGQNSKEIYWDEKCLCLQDSFRSKCSKDTFLLNLFQCPALLARTLHILIKIESSPISRDISHTSKCSIPAYQQGHFTTQYILYLIILLRTSCIQINVVCSCISKDTFHCIYCTIQPYQKGHFLS